MFKKQNFFTWLLITLISGALATLTIANSIELPFHDKARDVVSFGSGDNSDIAYDASGKVISNWHQNNPLDDIIKFALLVFAVFALWKFLSTFIKWWWLRILIIVIGIPTVAWIYIFATW